MEKFTTLKGLVAPLSRANIDTDAIIPKQFLKSIKRTGFGPHLFDAWRYLDPDRGQNVNERRPNPEFVLNQPRYRGAKILLTGRNFGCGSSREHAPWAIKEYGFRVLIAPNFADIFFNNCFKNGLLPIVLNENQVEKLLVEVEKNSGYELTVDLEKQVIITPTNEIVTFPIDSFHKYCLLNGLDEIGLTLNHTDKIKQFELVYREENPWLFNR